MHLRDYSKPGHLYWEAHLTRIDSKHRTTLPVVGALREGHAPLAILDDVRKVALEAVRRRDDIMIGWCQAALAPFVEVSRAHRLLSEAIEDADYAPE